MEVLTYFGDHHFAIISQVSLERNPYDAVHRWAFYVGISLAGLLILGASLSTTAAVKEAQGLMAGGFLCFVMVFCALLQVAYWRFRNPTQVEDAMLDTYDLVYDQAVRSPSSLQWQELAAIQDTFLCCGKRSPFGLVESPEADLCQGEEAAREDCLQSIQSFLRNHQSILSMLTSASLALTVPHARPHCPCPPPFPLPWLAPNLMESQGGESPCYSPRPGPLAILRVLLAYGTGRSRPLTQGGGPG
ncbi:tetraspanin-32 isoform X3 [Heterocephalus glaber]|nr:tetraspanin-32 isoform X3 [Heterocephalus glaber]